MKLKGARILIEELIHQGVSTVFGYPGGAVLDIYDELYKCADRIDHVITAHEQGACHAADGYARASGKVGVVIATSGPGATNLVTGIANANLDSVPLVAITGNVAVSALGRDSFQEVDIVGITQPVVKHNFMVRDITELEQTIKEAFRLANSGRKGPVLIDIPKNVQIAELEYGDAVLPARAVKPVLEYRRQEILEAIWNCKRPFIYCGGGVISAEAEAELLELSKRLNAPVGLSMMGRTAVPDSYPLNLGMTGMHGSYTANKAQTDCDLEIAVGVRFSDRATGDISEYAKKKTVIHIDIDKSELGKNVSPNLRVQGNVKEIMADLLLDIPQQSHPSWMRQIEEYKKVPASEPPRTGEFIPKNIIETVRKTAKDSAVVATDVGQHQIWTCQYYDFEKPRTLLTSGGLGTMGYGLGAAIGGCIANRRERTILFTSEGSFAMNCNELCTVVSQELPITIVILHNGVLGMVRQWQGIFYGQRYSQTTLNRKTDFVKLAEAYGLRGFRAASIDELEAVLQETEKDPKGAYLIDCLIDKDEKVFPMIPPGRSVKDIILRD